MTAYPHLFTPITLGSVELRNRVTLSAMTTGFGFVDGVPTDDTLAYYNRRATGLGLATVGFSAVRPEGRVENQIAWMWPEGTASALEPLADAIHRAGAAAGIQLGHGGRQVSPKVTGTDPVAPSAVLPEVHVTIRPHELSTTEVEDVIGSFAVAAQRAVAAGFDVIELHGAHGYLVQQFLSAEANRREDRFGGETTIERATFAVEVIRAIREAAGDAALVVRMNGSDIAPGGMTVDDAMTIAPVLVDAGADALLVSAGVYGSVPWTIPLLDDADGCFLDLAAAVRSTVEVPVIGVGRITTPAEAEDAISSGRCDAVALGRALLADPDWAPKALADEAERIRPCLATVQGCAGQLQHGGQISCSVNPDVGRETLATAAPSAGAGADASVSRARILVIGGGPAGMEAARRAAEHGHEVRLLERDDTLGGAMRLAARTPALAHFARLTGWFAAELDRLGVEVVTGVEVPGGGTTGDGPLAGAWDLAVVATGAVTVPPVLDGYEDLPAWTAEGLLAGERSSLDTDLSEGPVVVLGTDQYGLAVAEMLHRQGRSVTAISSVKPGRDLSGVARRAYLSRLVGADVAVGEPLALSAAGVTWRNHEGTEKTAPAVAVVVAEPRRGISVTPPSGIATVETVGDAKDPRTIGDAITEARDLVDAFTRARGEH
jgi:2,4-dienoyl-CoA reductase-like NADH-dependent reductase (Old Yellow Enzyme family)/thioredoxin reductase